MKVEKILSTIPNTPGVYKMIDDEGRILYVGKAKDLKKRVQSYFRKNAKHTVRTQKMIEKVVDVQTISVDSDLEAIMLETNIIKQLRPKYNVLMKDDKNFSYIKVHMKEDFPRISVVREVKNDGAKYFGPKTSAKRAKDTLKLLKKLFPFRHCRLTITCESEDEKESTVSVKGNIKYPCLDYYIKRCEAPCIGKVTRAQYKKNIHAVHSFLKGDTKEIMQTLTNDMMNLATAKKFERAARIRDKIKMIEALTEKQKITTPLIDSNLDVLHFAVMGTRIFFAVMQIRNGKMIQQENFELKSQAKDVPEASEMLASFIKKYYVQTRDFPKTILVPELPDDATGIKNFLKNQAGHTIHFHTPKKGEKMQLLSLAYKNALLYGEKQQTRFETSESKEVQKALDGLAGHLNLEKTPVRMECYDISHIGGTHQVGSMVVFKKGRPENAHYRIFKLKKVTEGVPNDFESIEEVLDRRLRWLTKNKPPQGVTIKKPTKKEEAILKEKYKHDGEILIAKEKKDIVGVVLYRLLDKNRAELVVLTHNTVQIGYALMQKIIEREKVTRLYICAEKEDREFYHYFGFNDIHKIPSDVLKKEGDVLSFNYAKRSYDASFSEKPQLIVIDGGKGQLSSALKSLKKHNLEIPIISIAKKEELIFTPGKKVPLAVKDGSPEHYLIQQIRNEAHRFAIEFNRNLRSKAMVASSLDTIKGIGEKNKRQLLKAFGSVDNIAMQPISVLKRVVGEKCALRLKSELKRKES